MINTVLINFKQLDLILTFKEFATTGINRVKTTGIIKNISRKARRKGTE